MQKNLSNSTIVIPETLTSQLLKVTKSFHWCLPRTHIAFDVTHSFSLQLLFSSFSLCPNLHIWTPVFSLTHTYAFWHSNNLQKVYEKHNSTRTIFLYIKSSYCHNDHHHASALWLRRKSKWDPTTPLRFRLQPLETTVSAGCCDCEHCCHPHLLLLLLLLHVLHDQYQALWLRLGTVQYLSCGFLFFWWMSLLWVLLELERVKFLFLLVNSFLLFFNKEMPHH